MGKFFIEFFRLCYKVGARFFGSVAIICVAIAVFEGAERLGNGHLQFAGSVILYSGVALLVAFVLDAILQLVFGITLADVVRGRFRDADE